MLKGLDGFFYEYCLAVYVNSPQIMVNLSIDCPTMNWYDPALIPTIQRQNASKPLVILPLLMVLPDSSII